MRSPDAESLIETARLETLAEHLVELDENYFYAGARLLLAVKHASLPPNLGGSLPKAEREFNRIFALTDGKFLLAKVLWARYYATAAQDRAAFQNALHQVVDAPLDLLPNRRLLTVIAKRRARQLLLRADDLFAAL